MELLVLDIGANIGFFAIAARGYFPEALIHAYEPNPRIIPYLDQQSRIANFKYFPEAVGSVDGRVNLLDSGDSNQARTQTIEDGLINQVSFR